MKCRSRLSHQNGVAIIMVLLIVALATSITAYMSVQQNSWQRQVESQLDRTQARRIGIAGIDWARAILAEDARVNNYDHDKELWGKRLPAITIENGEVSGMIEDCQGLFNLNNMVRNGAASESDVAQFRRLLMILELPEGLADALVDWMDNDAEMRFPAGAEDVYYLAQKQPYRTANHTIVDLNELILVKGFDKRTIDRLRPFVTALPMQTQVNVNFVSAEVLVAMLEGLSLSEARVIVQLRVSTPFKDIESFTKRLPSKYASIVPTLFGVSSQYFMVTGKAKLGRAQVTTHALLQRAGGWPSVIWQKLL